MKNTLQQEVMTSLETLWPVLGHYLGIPSEKWESRKWLVFGPCAYHIYDCICWIKTF